MTRTRLAAIAMGIVVTAALTGCGSDDDGGDNGADSSGFAEKSADDIVAEAKKAMGELTSLRVAGEMTSDGQAAEIDLQMSNNGSCTGTLGLGEIGTLEILGADDTVWFKADAEFWTNTGVPDASAVQDKWVVDEAGDFADFCNVEEFVDTLFDDESDATYESKGTEDVDGEEAVVIESDDPEEGLSTGYISVDEPHVMLKIEKEGDEGGSVTFSDFDEEFEATAPSDDEIVNLNELG